MLRTIVVIAIGRLVFAQNPTRTLNGSVTDFFGAVIPAASVAATPAAGGSTVRVTTGPDGTYRFTNLPAGAYTVRFETSGFQPLDQRVTIPPDRDAIHDVTLSPGDLFGEPVVVGVADAASSRFGYAPSSALAPNGIFTAYGKFPLNTNVRITDLNAFERPIEIVYSTPTQLAGIIPNDTETGNWFLEFIGAGQQRARAPVKVVQGRPTIFTINQTGSGDGIFTDPNYSVITRANPARPGVFHTGWMTNGGSIQNTGPPIQDKRPFFSDVKVRVANRPVEDIAVQYFGPSGINGADQMNIRFQSGWRGCGVPVQVGVLPVGVTTTPGGERAYVWGNEVTVPISTEGACEDTLGFNQEEVLRLFRRGSMRIMEARISELTLASSSAAQSNRTLGTLSGSEWTDSVYRPPPPVGTCQYRVSWSGSTPPAARRMAFTGNATATVPWGQFNLTPNSNSGPYSQLFSFPPNFTQGNYSLNVPVGFTVDGLPFSQQLGGTYQRSAGLMREHVAGQFPRVDPVIAYDRFLDQVLASITLAPPATRAPLFTDFNLIFNNGSRGTHTIRCIAETGGDHSFIVPALDSYLPLLPKNPNDTTFALRFFPREQIKRAVSSEGPVNNVLVTFDAALQFSNLGLVLPQ